jgi:hypothetical protein
VKRRYLIPVLVLFAAGCGSKGGGSSAGSISGTLSSTPSPPVVGHDNSFTLTLTDGGKPLTAAKVDVAFFFKGLNQAGPTATCTESSPGAYEAREVSCGMGGKWEVEATVTPPGKPSAKLTLPFTVAKGSGDGE